jgi:hypothetical protein
MEQEICRRKVGKKKFGYKLHICISLGYAVLAVIINFIIGISIWGDRVFYGMSKYADYWIGWGNMILGLVAALIFLILQYFSPQNTTLILTNKRIYFISSKKLLFARTLERIENYNLDKIVGYEFYKDNKGKHTFSQLTIKTTISKISFAIDEEFYNIFVKTLVGDKAYDGLAKDDNVSC